MTTKRKKPPTKPIVVIKPVVVEVEQHVPVVAADDMQMSPRMAEALDRCLVEGRADLGDGVEARRLEPPPESAIVHLPRSDLLLVSWNDIRPANRWIPAAHLTPAAVNGFAYTKASKLYVEPSIPIFFSLESLFGRGERNDPASITPGMHDTNSRKMQGCEKVEIEAMCEIDNTGTIGSGGASKSQFLRYRGCWLPLRRLSKLAARQAEQPRLATNYNPAIKPL